MICKIELLDLESKRIYVKVESNFIKYIFNSSIKFLGTQHNLAKFLKCSDSSITFYKNGTSFIPLKLITKILHLFPNRIRIKLIREMNKSIINIRHGYGTSQPVKIKFPIEYSPILARILGHILGDGGISKVNQTFYSNKNKKLIILFKKDMEKVFGKIIVYHFKYESDTVMIVYPTIIGVILTHLFGPMRGNLKHVPKQILTSDKNSKSLFIQALFDDEGNVSISKKTIQINMTNRNIIKIMKSMLYEFGIKAGKISKKKRTPNRKIIYWFRISGKNNLKLFSKYIGFMHSEKQEKLDYILKSYK